MSRFLNSRCRRLRLAAFWGIAACLPAQVQAAALSVSLELPRLSVAEYHRPYVAIWIARADHSVAANLAVLYDVALADEEGEKWLKDMRQWWRRGGRALDLPIDGLSGATRPPGTHVLQFDQALNDLEPGSYRLMVEAAREVGGRETIEISFDWPVTDEQRLSVAGSSELGAVDLTLTP